MSVVTKGKPTKVKGAAKVQHKNKTWHRARKGPACPGCGRRMRRGSLSARDCQFHGGDPMPEALVKEARARFAARNSLAGRVALAGGIQWNYRHNGGKLIP